MTLLIDAGNSAVKWARLAADGTLAETGRELHRDAGELEARLAAVWKALPRLTRAVGCTVAHAGVADDVDGAVRSLGIPGTTWLRAQPEFIGPVSLVNGYRDPMQLGADRWHALLGASSLLPCRSLVAVNAGTATTVDCVRGNAAGGRFVGGCIAPGVRLMLESLARGTAGLPLAGGEPSDFPDTTDRAIVTGVMDAQAGLIERVWKRFAATIAESPRLLLAGGYAEALALRLPAECAPVIERDLVLRGLALRARAG